jgi:hypothetical protein
LELYFGRSGESRSPSPTYTLPPAADALAQAMAMHRSPVQHRSRVTYDHRILHYIDIEATESKLIGPQCYESSS